MKTAQRILFIAIAALAATGRAFDFAAWGKKAEITFSGYTGTETLTNFPALVVLGSGTISGFDYADCLAGGADLRFTDSTGLVELPYEIESWNPAGDSHVWVRIPELVDADTSIWAYWNMAGQTPPDYTSNGAVWANGYVAVYHLSDPGSPVGDSSALQNAAVEYGTVEQGAAGVVSAAAGFPDGNNDWLQAPYRTELDGMAQLTLQGWMLDTQNDTQPRALISKRVSSTGSRSYYLFKYTNRNLFFYVGSAGGEFANTTTDANQWYSFAATYDKYLAIDRMKLFLDGKFRSARNDASGDVPIYSDDLFLGILNASYGNAWKGRLDEIRLSNVSRSTDWLRADYLTIISNAVFQSYGIAQSSVPGLPAVFPGAVTNITTTSAWLCGNLVSTGASDTAVIAYWGTTDGDTNGANWAASTVLAAPQAPGEFSVQATGLSSASTYYYHVAASNATGVAWASSGGFFITGEVAVDKTADAAEEGLVEGVFTISRPVTCTNEPATVNYAVGGTATGGVDYVDNLGSSVTLPAGAASVAVTVRPLANWVNQSDTTVSLTLLDGLYPVGSPDAASLTISNQVATPASDIYVDAAATGAADGTSWADAYVTIQDAMDDSAFYICDGITVHVAGGAYAEMVSLVSRHGGTGAEPNRIVAKPGETPVVDSGKTLANGFSLTGASYLSIEGIEVRNATAAGLVFASSPYCTLSNVVVSGSGTHGISLENSEYATLRQCVSTNNASYGLNLYASGRTRVEDSSMSYNGSHGLYLGPKHIQSDYVVLLRTRFVRNGGAGVNLVRDGDSDNWWIESCLAYGNKGSGIHKDAWNQGMVLTNSILVANHDYDLYPSAEYGTGVRVTHSCLFASRRYFDPGTKHFIDGGGNLFTDPGFVAPWADDFRLYEGAPAAGAGADGKDLGLYPDGPRVPLPPINTYYVRVDGSDANTGLDNTPGAAFQTLQKAADLVTPGDVVHVQSGTYAMGVTNIPGGSGDQWVNFIADGSVTVSNATGAALALRGTHRVSYEDFTFTAGVGNGVDLDQAQGCRLANCVIADSQLVGAAFLRSHENELLNCGLFRNKSNGARIYLSGKNRFIGCRFNANTGSGIYCGKYGGGTIQGGDRSLVRHSLFWGNTGTAFFTARDSYSHDWTIENSVFYANGAGIHINYFGGARALVRNTIVSSNTGDGIYREGDAITVMNNDVYGNGLDYHGTFTPVNSISADPLFRNAAAGNFKIPSVSPCVDAGTNQLWMARGQATATDFDGNPRIANKLVDIGAYETATTASILIVR